jgi:hypothetical protein
LPKPFKVLTPIGCLGLAALGGVLPFVGWTFLVFALHVLVHEFETGRDWIKGMRRRRSCRAGLRRRAAIPGHRAACTASIS